MKAELKNRTLVFTPDNAWDDKFVDFIVSVRPQIMIYAINTTGIDSEDNMFVNIESGAIGIDTEGK